MDWIQNRGTQNESWVAIYKSQGMEAAWKAIDDWMDEEHVVHVGDGLLLSYKKDEILPSATT